MQPKRTPTPSVFAIAFGEKGRAALVLMMLITGAGLLLDFWITNLHPLFSIGFLLSSVPVGLYWLAHRTIRMSRKQDPSEYIRNMALAVVAGQAGCSTVILVFLALFGGMYLDARFDTHPIFTLVLVLLSVPLGLYMMVRVVLSSTSRITPPSKGGSSAGASHKKENGL
ncbi:MAG TPA: AtpZ/AtpI family protein [Aggregatilineaceae bacterium]|nr:AtpZ/AtpI family protein [Aggregatilineaceae bacterium]